MGNKSTKSHTNLVSNHPNFKNGQVVTEKERKCITTAVVSDDEEYNRWKALLLKHSTKLSKSEFLLIPKQHRFTKHGFCANTGDVSVRYLVMID